MIRRVLCRCLIMLTAMLAAACASAATGLGTAGWREEARGFAYKVFTRKESVAMFPERGSRSPQLLLTVHLLDTSDAALALLLAKTLFDGTDCRRYTEARFAAIKKKYAETKPSGASIVDSGTLQWEFSEAQSGALYKDGVIVIDRRRYLFDGGARGITEKEYFVLDRAAGRRLRLPELIQPQGSAELRRLAEASLRTRYAKAAGIPNHPSVTLKSLGFFENTVEIPVDNFFVNPEGLGFAWNPYAIAPQSFGTVEVVIPWRDVRPLLSARGAALRSAFMQK